MRAFRQGPVAGLLTAPFALIALVFVMTTAPARADMQLQRGYYVRVEEGCARASNATLALVHKTGINAARVACDFTALTPTGPNTFRYTERCEEMGGPDPFENTGTIELLDTTRFRQMGEGWEQVMGYCPQSALPEPWASNDISDIVN